MPNEGGTWWNKMKWQVYFVAVEQCFTFLFCCWQFRGLVLKASISELESVAQNYCEDDWDNLKRKYDIDGVELSRSCFSYTFMVILLRNSFGIPFDEKRYASISGTFHRKLEIRICARQLHSFTWKSSIWTISNLLKLVRTYLNLYTS